MVRTVSLFNTLTRAVEPVASGDGEVRIYTCGPTVYNFAHIGNLRTFLFQDLLKRAFRAAGHDVRHCMNITDVEDKIIRNSMAKGMTLREYTEIYEKAFLEDMATMRFLPPWKMVRATEHIDEMVEMVQKLAAKGLTYESEGSTYYRIAGFNGYGKLSHNDFSGIRAGARVDVDEYDKTDARDFVLWKQRKGD